MKRADFLICGGGIVGLTIARELVKEGYENIVIIEKENALGKHASGRNSGVLHSGIYYTSDSLKAKSCLNGNFLMREYCKEKNLPLLKTGKVIVVKNEDEIISLKELYSRAIKNGAKVELIDEKQLSEIEPYAKTYERALYSHYTAVVDPLSVLKSLHDDLIASKRVDFFFNTEFKGIKGNNTVLTSNGAVDFGIFINSAGAYSDKVAHAFGIGLNYRLIPFKGIYKKLKNEKSFMVRGNIYPVPDIRNPFLGIHFTRSVKGAVYLGPTAIPSFGRENYGIVSGVDRDAVDILMRDAILFLVNPKFRKVALAEPKKYFMKYFFEDAEKLIKELEPDDVISSDKVGIRPQLVDWKKRELVSDFIIIKNGNSIHILNATSPAFTSSMDFAKFISRNYIC